MTADERRKTQDERRKRSDEGAPPSVLRPSSFVQITRRRSLRALAATGVGAAGAVAFTGCGPPETAFEAQSRVRSAEDEIRALEDWYATLCRGCGAGCGVVVRVVEGRAKKVEGNPNHPVNQGKLCARGQALVQEQYHPDRLAGPLARTAPTLALLGTPERGAPPLFRRGEGSRLGRVTWSEGLDALVGRLSQLRAQGRAGEVAILTRPLRGQQAVVVERFASAYGAQWLTLDPFGEAPLREATRRVLGSEHLPRFDVQRARFVLSFGADFLSTWLSPVRYGWEYGIFRQGAIPAAKSTTGGAVQPPPTDLSGRPRGYLVQVDPRFSATAANADEWLPVHPGSEGQLALSVAQVLLAEGLADPAAAQAFGDPRPLATYSPEAVAPDVDVTAERIRQIARAFAAGRPSVAIAGGSATAHTNGSDVATAVLALNALVGAIGAPGGLVPSPLLASEAPRPASTLAEWQDLTDRLRAGRVQAVLVYGANPVYELPAALGFGTALRAAPFVASFAPFLDETAQLADVLLPAHLPLEEWGDDVPDPAPALTYTVQQPVVRPAHDTRSSWDVLLALADAIGGPVGGALPWRSFQEAVREAAGSRAGATGESHSDAKRAWLAVRQRGGWWPESPAPPVPPAGTGAVRAALAALRAVAALPAARFAGDPGGYPFALLPFVHNTIGAGDAAHLPWLQATPDPVTSAVWRTWVEINPRRARELGLREGDVVRLRSPYGQIEVPAYISPAAPPDVLAVPLGQGHSAYGRWAQDRGADPRVLLAPLADAATGALAYAATRVRLEKAGRRAPLPKMEGTVPARQVPGRRVLKVVRF